MLRAFFAVLASLLLFATAGVARLPNLVVIMADDLGYGDVGYNGSTVHATPHLDRLAGEGLRFDNFYVSSPVCTPTRVAFLTARHPVRVGFHALLWPTSKGGLPESERTLPEILRSHGYRTGLIGKWHLGHAETANLPLNHGFDEFYGMPYPNDMGPMHSRAAAMKETWPPMPMMTGNEIVEAPIDVNLLTQQYTSAASRFIAENRARPFFLFLSHAMPHSIVGASADFRGRSRNGLYGDAVQELDWSVGEILRLLRALDLESSTMVVFTSDNGAVLRAMYQGNDDTARVMFPDLTFGSNAPLRGGKVSTFEGGVRVPTFIRWPGMVPPGRRATEPVWIADLMPTFLELAGLTLPTDRTYDGISLAPLVRGEGAPPADRPLFFGSGEITAMREGPWKLVLPNQPRFTGDHGGQPLLFDLATDPSESKNLAAAHPQRVKGMVARLKAWQSAAEADPTSR
jgi:arylsulfatase A-like enzyme